MNNILLAEKLKEFLNEDLNFGDMSLKYLQSSKVISGSFIAKQAGVVCGQEIPQAAYDLLGNAHYTALVEDGKYVSNGTIIGKATGQASVLLTGERVIFKLGSTDEWDCFKNCQDHCQIRRSDNQDNRYQKDGTRFANV